MNPSSSPGTPRSAMVAIALTRPYTFIVMAMLIVLERADRDPQRRACSILQRPATKAASRRRSK